MSSKHLHLDERFSVASASVIAKNALSATVKATVVNAAFHVVRADGTIYKDEPAASHLFEYVLKRQGEAWLVDAVLSS